MLTLDISFCFAHFCLCSGHLNVCSVCINFHSACFNFNIFVLAFSKMLYSWHQNAIFSCLFFHVCVCIRWVTQQKWSRMNKLLSTSLKSLECLHLVMVVYQPDFWGYIHFQDRLNVEKKRKSPFSIVWNSTTTTLWILDFWWVVPSRAPVLLLKDGTAGNMISKLLKYKSLLNDPVTDVTLRMFFETWKRNNSSKVEEKSDIFNFFS